MIPFQSICEFLTCNQRYSWFYFSRNIFNWLESQEKVIVHAEYLEGDSIRCWYPREKWVRRDVHQDEFKRLLQKAIDAGDFELVKQLKLNRKENNDSNLPSV